MEKLLAIIALGQNLFGKWLFQKLIARVIVIMCMAIVACVMIGGIIVGGFFAAYVLLLQHGIEPKMALMIVLGSLLVATIFLISVIGLYIRHLKEMPKKLLQKNLPSVSHATEIADAFLEGLLGKAPHKPK